MALFSQLTTKIDNKLLMESHRKSHNELLMMFDKLIQKLQIPLDRNEWIDNMRTQISYLDDQSKKKELNKLIEEIKQIDNKYEIQIFINLLYITKQEFHIQFLKLSNIFLTNNINLISNQLKLIKNKFETLHETINHKIKYNIEQPPPPLPPPE